MSTICSFENKYLFLTVKGFTKCPIL